MSAASRGGGASLARYRAKRRFAITPEPRGSGAARDAGIFCVQKHAASHLHYDFRLELDGVLLSWAVPKGPSLDPAVKRLAIEVEPHPIEYANFEGAIPEGQYGAGTVIVWDRGHWLPDDDPRKQLTKGELRFKLEGEKLRGTWMLKRTHAGDSTRPSWLLFKIQDAHARRAPYDVLAAKPASVFSRRVLEELDGAAPPESPDRSRPTRRAARTATGRSERTRSRKKQADSQALPTGAVPARLPKQLSPQLATLVSAPPDGDGWLHEIKLDGYRMLCFLADGRARFITRNGKDWTPRLGTLAAAAARLAVSSAVLDGELVALDPEGRSSFQRLQSALKRSPDSLSLVCFDLPHCDGHDFTKVPLRDRKQRLRRLFAAPGSTLLQFSEHISGSGPAVFEQACRRGLEGIVSKQAESPYSPGRSRTWLKCKCEHGQEFIIGGFTAPRGTRRGLGALLLGLRDESGLRYCGRVGTGFDEKTLAELRRLLDGRVVAAPPFHNPPVGAAANGATWVRPELVAQVRFREWTDDGVLRQPVFEGLRDDKPASQVRLEVAAPPRAPLRRKAKSKRGAPAATRASVASSHEPVVGGVEISHPERLIFETPPLTKLDVAHFYEAVAERMLPHVSGRPLMLLRCPQGAGGKCFYQKHIERLPEPVRGIAVKESRGEAIYAAVDDLPGLIMLCQFNALEIHPWAARASDVERPDRLILDLDPGPGVEWPTVAESARRLRTILKKRGLKAFVKTSGGKGLHVVAPLAPATGWEALTQFAKATADELGRTEPDLYAPTMSKSRRRGRIFVDHLRNGRGATCAAPYSLRARPGAPVSAPLRWGEIDELKGGGDIDVREMLARIRGADPWRGFASVRQSLPRG